MSEIITEGEYVIRLLTHAICHCLWKSDQLREPDTGDLLAIEILIAAQHRVIRMEVLWNVLRAVC